MSGGEDCKVNQVTWKPEGMNMEGILFGGEPPTYGGVVQLITLA